MNTFCEIKQIVASEYVKIYFLYDGKRIKPEDTPNQLGMEDEGMKLISSWRCLAVVIEEATKCEEDSSSLYFSSTTFFSTVLVLSRLAQLQFG
ncbi:hypothetical protein C5167_048093 [Papaver somniferum]|uniref:Rad60/SUMO-like domain-containing protein n=1 Tax=Papaver somniferum TaxID=3469 RepID=A0A4Y7KL51_PAPSO|nr:hypothetical protein C5167_048093 [Papaver somniferum]